MVLKAFLIWQLVLLVLALIGYWNYRRTCRTAEDLMRLFRNGDD